MACHAPTPSAPLQPALFVAGLAAVERLRAENPKAVEGCSATAGLSLGEYTALVFAGAMSFEDGIKVGAGFDSRVQARIWVPGVHHTRRRSAFLPASTRPATVLSPMSMTPALPPLQVVKVRAESMAAAAGMGRPHGMLSVVGLNDADLEAVCKEVGCAGLGWHLRTIQQGAAR